jgi:hypothetical protein
MMADKKAKNQAPRGANVATGRQQFAIQALTPFASVGVWAYTVISNIIGFHKAAAATVSVLHIPVPYDEKGGLAADGFLSEFSVDYQVSTANLTAAPTAVLRKHTKDPATGITTQASVPGTLTFTGTNTVGTAIGTYNAKFAVTDPAALGDFECLIFELTMNEAATSVLDIRGATATYR